MISLVWNVLPLHRIITKNSSTLELVGEVLQHLKVSCSPALFTKELRTHPTSTSPSTLIWNPSTRASNKQVSRGVAHLDYLRDAKLIEAFLLLSNFESALLFIFVLEWMEGYKLNSQELEFNGE